MQNRSVIIVLGGVLAIAATSFRLQHSVSAATPVGGPFSNQPIALSWDDSQLAVSNPEAGTVSVFQVAGDKNTKVSEVPVGKEPIGVAWSSDGNTLYVANQADGTVSGGTPSWCTTHPEFSRQVKTLLLTLGFPTTTKLDQSGCLSAKVSCTSCIPSGRGGAG